MVVDGKELTKKDIDDLDCRLWNILNSARDAMHILVEMKDNVIDTTSNIKPSIRQMVDMVKACERVHDALRREMFYFKSSLFVGVAKIRPLDWMFANYISKEDYKINIEPIIKDMANFTQFLTCIDNLEQKNKLMINVIFERLQAQYNWVRMTEDKVYNAIRERDEKKDRKRPVKSRSLVNNEENDCEASE